MKRLNKIQKEIEGLAGQVPALNDKQKAWAISAYRYQVGIREDKQEARCPECGKLITFQGDNRDLDCPNCGTKIHVTRYYDVFRKNNKKERFFVVMNTVGGWQVTRLILMQREVYVRKPNTPWAFFEVCQAWNNPKVNTTYFRALPKTCAMGGYPYNPYKLWELEYEYNKELKQYICTDVKLCQLEARIPGGPNYFNTQNLAPGAQILPLYKQRGITANAVRALDEHRTYSAMGLFELIGSGTYKPMYETLLKDRDYKLFNRVTDRLYSRYASAYFTAYKICKRNGYDYKRNLAQWLDLVDLLVSLKMDYHNPHYVCPEDLDAMHKHLARLSGRKEEIDKVLSMKEQNEAYKERVAKFVNMNIHAGDLKLVVLPSIMAFKKEGDRLGHCVYRCGYYNKTTSLILSARDTKGKRWETIEVSLRNFKVIQCYGYADKFSSRHDEILNLVNDNMDKIRKRARAKAC